MLFKHGKFVCIVIGLCLLVTTGGCSGMGAGRPVGRTLEKENLDALNPPGGRHIQRTNTFELTYDYAIDPEKEQIRLDGRIRYTFDTETHRLGAILTRMQVETIIVQVLFTDEQGKVLDDRQFEIYPYQSHLYPALFSKTLAYRPDFSHLTFRLTTWMKDGLSRMRSTQISATKTQEYP